MVAALNDAESRSSVEAERALLRELEGGCQVPLGAWARMENGELKLEACLLSPDGREYLRESSTGVADDAVRIGKQLGQALKASGGARILQLAGR
jgi:hydroxymethylbilane synthase